MSSFDVGSDFINALSLLGYIHSSKLNVSTEIQNISSKEINVTILDLDDQVSINKKEMSSYPIWGCITMFLIFLPGIAGFLPVDNIQDIQRRMVGNSCLFSSQRFFSICLHCL